MSTGGLAQLVDSRQHFIGTVYFNAGTLIVCSILTRKHETGYLHLAALKIN